MKLIQFSDFLQGAYFNAEAADVFAESAESLVQTFAYFARNSAASAVKSQTVPVTPHFPYIS